LNLEIPDLNLPRQTILQDNFLIFAFLIFLTLGCNRYPNNHEIIEKYNSTDFMTFYNSCYEYRGQSDSNYAIIITFGDRKDKEHCTVVGVLYNKKYNKIIDIKPIFKAKGTSLKDSSRISKNLRLFIKYSDLFVIQVDKDSNILLCFNDKPLIKFHNKSKIVTNYDQRTYRQLEGLWYEAIK